MVDLLTVPRTVVRGGVAAALGLGTAVRGARVFHPHGATRTCRLVVDGGQAWGSTLLDDAAVHEGVVRLSRGVGLPAPLPDVDGLALRLPGLGRDGRPLDLLANSAWRYAFAPSVIAPTWSSVLPYRTGTGRRVLLGARPTREGFTLLVAPLLGGVDGVGQLTLGEPVDGEDLRFAPTVGADDLEPVELFRTLRAWAYDASQAGRD